jgi:hypothetical protein
MSKLAQLQQDFQAYVLHGAEPMKMEVVTTDRVPAEVRLNIYSTAYRLRLLEALETEYTALKAALGDEEFERLGLAYIDAYPSPYPNLRWFGGNLDAWLKAVEPYSNNLVLSELATFEWAMGLAFDAPDAAVVTIEQIASVPGEQWPEMRFVPHPSLQRRELDSNAPLIWKSVAAEQEPPQPIYQDIPLTWIIWRHELKTYFRSLPVDEAWALSAMTTGASFAEICEDLCEWVDELLVAQHAASLLKEWVSQGLITQLRFV